MRGQSICPKCRKIFLASCPDCYPDNEIAESGGKITLMQCNKCNKETSNPYWCLLLDGRWYVDEEGTKGRRYPFCEECLPAFLPLVDYSEIEKKIAVSLVDQSEYEEAGNKRKKLKSAIRNYIRAEVRSMQQMRGRHKINSNKDVELKLEKVLKELGL